MSIMIKSMVVKAIVAAEAGVAKATTESSKDGCCEDQEALEKMKAAMQQFEEQLNYQNKER